MKPALFADLDFDAALARASADGKMLFVDATASWCQPCKVMDRTTWADAAVVDAVRARGLAIQIDVDASAEIAKRLKIRAMPTVVAFRGGVEVDRVVGLQKRDDLVGWLEALDRGETSLDRARAAAKAAPRDLKARIAFARMLVQRDALDEATSEVVWLWQNMLDVDPSFVGVRHSFFLQDIRELVARHPAARAAFEKLRDAAPPPSADWFSLNGALGDEAKTLAWFDEARGSIATNAEIAKAVEMHVVPLLHAAGRWADAGAAYAQPVASVERLLAPIANMKSMPLPPDMPREMLAELQKEFVDAIAKLRRSLEAAGRDEDLRAVDEAIRAVDPTLLERAS